MARRPSPPTPVKEDASLSRNRFRYRGSLARILRLARLFLKAMGEFHRDNGFFLSAGISFNILMSLIPLMMLLLALLGSYLYRAEDVLIHIKRYLWNAAPGLDPKVMQTLFDVVRTRRIVGVLGFAGLLWVSTWVFGSLRIALNAVFQVRKGRGIVRGVGVDILMICIVGSFMLLSMTLTSFVALVQGHQSLLPFAIGPALRWLLKYPLPLFFSYCTFFLIYIVLPNRKVHFRSAVLAALVTGTFWEAAKHFFSWYFTHLTRLPLIYGSLSTVVVSASWVYYSAAILLVGGEFARLLETDTEVPERRERTAKNEAATGPAITAKESD